MKSFKLKIISFCFLFSSWILLGQYSSEFEVNKANYPNAQMVQLNKATIIKIGVENDKLNIEQDFFEENLYLDESAIYGSKKEINFSSFFELNEIEASSFLYTNGKYKESKVKEYLIKDDLDQSFYDDTKSMSFIFPNLNKGSKSTLKYSEKVKNPRFLSPFYFGNFYPILNNKVIIIADKNIELKFKEFNTEGLEIQFTKKEKRNTIIYTWELKAIDEYKYEENVPNYKTIFPHIVPIITSYKTKKGKSIKVLGDVSQLYQWYYSLVKDINKEESDKNLVALVHEITANDINDLEKVKSIYYWTQQNIKYIAFEYALGGFIPREANDVYKKKFGDCKDNSSILFKMLEIAGIDGSLTWIGTRKIPYRYSEVPTPAVDNHMILSYRDNNNIYFLDATGRYLPLGLPSSFIQGKEALVSKNENEFEIITVPIVPASKNAIVEFTTIKLDGENVIGSSKTEISGYEKINFYHALETKSSEIKIKEFYNRNFEKGNNKFLIENLTETNKYDYDRNLIVNYTFNIDGYAKKLSDEIFINLNLYKTLSVFKINKERKNSIEYNYKRSFDGTTIFSIPEGYVVDHIPENSESSNEFISSKISYTVKNNEIIHKHAVELNYLILTVEQQKEVNDFIKKVEKEYKKIIVLKKEKI